MGEKMVSQILSTRKLLQDSNRESQQYLTLSFPCPSYSNFRKIHFQGVVLSATPCKIADPEGHMFQIESSPLNFRGSASDSPHQQQGLPSLRSTLYSSSSPLPGLVFKVHLSRSNGGPAYLFATTFITVEPQRGHQMQNCSASLDTNCVAS